MYDNNYDSDTDDYSDDDNDYAILDKSGASDQENVNYSG